MKCDVEFTAEFYSWWQSLSEDQQDEVAAVVGLLEEQGVDLGYPRSSDIRGSRHGRLRELRIQVGGRPFRVLYAFDWRRVALLLVGGEKRDEKRWYSSKISLAERLFDEHLRTLERRKGDE